MSEKAGDTFQADNIKHLSLCSNNGCERCENLMHFYQACDGCGTWGHNDSGPCPCITQPAECQHDAEIDDESCPECEGACSDHCGPCRQCGGGGTFEAAYGVKS